MAVSMWCINTTGYSVQSDYSHMVSVVPPRHHTGAPQHHTGLSDVHQGTVMYYHSIPVGDVVAPVPRGVMVQCRYGSWHVRMPLPVTTWTNTSTWSHALLPRYTLCPEASVHVAS